MVYAGFWLRCIAFLVDGVLLAIVNFVVNPGFMQMATAGLVHSPFQVEYRENGLIMLLIRWLYFTLLESSSCQATIGKKALGIKVTDEAGNRIGFGRANARFWSKIISALILGIGFIMAAFTEKKQALHDLIARTLIVRK